MLKLARIAVIAFALCLVAGKQAGATCIRFDAGRSGDAYLINTCGAPMNAAYFVNAEGSATDFGGTAYRLSLSPLSRTRLWSAGDQPIAGRYKIKVMSCFAPLTLVYRSGNAPTCQFENADAG